MSADLQAQIAMLNQQIAEMKAQMASKKAKPETEKAVKPYAKKNGHYFMLLTDKVPADQLQQIKDQIMSLFADEDIDAALCKIQLGRALKHRMLTKGEVFFWTPNQEQLMFGPVKSGINNAKPVELFTIDPQYVEDLGPAFDGDKSGKIEMELRAEVAEFKVMEAEQAEVEKLKKKLMKLQGK
jgi:hypothetical protein